MFWICIQEVGSIGLEFLSRGAKKCVFVDRSEDAIKKIRENILKIGEIESLRYEIYQKTSNILLGEFKSHNLKNSELEKEPDYRFDIIYLDPPYEKDESIEIRYIIENKILEENSLIVYETDNDKYIENVRKLEKEGILEILKIKKYGRPSIMYITGR